METLPSIEVNDIEYSGLTFKVIEDGPKLKITGSNGESIEMYTDTRTMGILRWFADGAYDSLEKFVDGKAQTMHVQGYFFDNAKTQKVDYRIAVLTSKMCTEEIFDVHNKIMRQYCILERYRRYVTNHHARKKFSCWYIYIIQYQTTLWQNRGNN